MIRENYLDDLLYSLHKEYLINIDTYNVKNVMSAYQTLINYTLEIDWNNYNPDIKSKYMTLVEAYDYHVKRWNKF